MLAVQHPARGLLAPGLAGPLCMSGPRWQKLRVYTKVAADEGGSVSYLRNARTGAEIYLVGTAHVSAKSAEEVFQVINQVEPNAVAVELCPERARKLMAGEKNETQNLLKSVAEFVQTPGGLGQKVASFAFKCLYSMLRNTGMEPGKEFKVACEEANKRGAELLYIDQDYKVTIKRLVDSMTMQDVFNLLTKQPNMPPELLKDFESDNLEDTLERLKTRENVRTTMKSMESLFPNLVRVMIHERDKIMVQQLRECSGKVVSVVGMAHMDGIERLWKELDA